MALTSRVGPVKTRRSQWRTVAHGVLAVGLLILATRELRRSNPRQLASVGFVAASGGGEGGEAVPLDSSDGEVKAALLVGGGFGAIVLLLRTLRSRTSAKWRGADVELLAVCLAVGWLIRFLLPTPEGVTKQAWSMLAIFVAMICAVVTGPLVPAGTTIVAAAVAIGSGTVTFADGMKAFTDEVVWLILLAFFFAEGFTKTGFGERLALTVIRAVGSTTLGLAYGLNLAELVVAAAMPSSAARAAAVFYPITVSVCKASGSEPNKGTEKKVGAFLVECCYQATATSSCMFLSGAAQNYFVLKLAQGIGVDVPNPFSTWFMAALGPGVASFVLSPLVAYYLLPPEAKKTPEAPEEAKRELEKLGPVSDGEKVFGSVIIGMVILWAGSSSLGIPPVVTALMGLALLLLTGVLTWEDCAANSKAWGTFVSFALLVSLAAMLNKLGIVQWVASSITAKITAAGLSAVPAFLVILLAYWLVHYLFASQVAHVSALYQPFALMMIQTGTPGLAAVLSLAFASNLFMSMTPYASAQSAVLFGGKYITTGEWYKAGFVYFIFYFVVWVSVGAAWWRAIGII